MSIETVRITRCHTRILITFQLDWEEPPPASRIAAVFRDFGAPWG